MKIYRTELSHYPSGVGADVQPLVTVAWPRQVEMNVSGWLLLWWRWQATASDKHQPPATVSDNHASWPILYREQSITRLYGGSYRAPLSSFLKPILSNLVWHRALRELPWVPLFIGHSSGYGREVIHLPHMAKTTLPTKITKRHKSINTLQFYSV